MFRERVAPLSREAAAVSREYRFLSDPGSVGDARWHVRFALESRLDDAKLGDVEIVVSELVTNAVRHGPGGLITLRLVTEEDGAVSGEVVDQGNGVVAIREHGLGSAEGGMGLPIVDALTSAWGVRPGSTHVWFRFDAD
jgi:anti-sigma regulatory factor (Ser/Thr protein kinase)